MIVTRYNFETNSSSMHSLSVRRTSGAYSIEELKRSEATHNDIDHDAFFIMKDGEMTTVEEMKEQLWIRDDDKEYYVSGYDIAFAQSPMQVLADFYGKFHYAIANAYDHAHRENRINEIKAIVEKYIPGIKITLRGISTCAKTNDNMLYEFLDKYNIAMEDFLMNSKYIVIVNIAEYNRMRFLGMVDESNIETAYHLPYEAEDKMVIENGVWKIQDSEDMRFGRSPYRVIGTVEGKTRYALATYESKNMDEVLAILQEVYPDLKSIELPPCWHNRDARDKGYCEDSALPFKIPLRDFILDKKYVIISDGDEYCIWNHFKKTKLFNRAEYPDEEILEHDFY